MRSRSDFPAGVLTTAWWDPASTSSTSTSRGDRGAVETPGGEGVNTALRCPVPGSGAQEVPDRLLAEHHRGSAPSGT
ncbi:hypothetical protein [Kineococcus arenarius]|uniref:hypothetical protein n=1 Tax=unclassified Kineococcus TaxID=2621656 RepID=UPI003D7EB18D